jgi:hypothetical protein
MRSKAEQLWNSPSPVAGAFRAKKLKALKIDGKSWPLLSPLQRAACDRVSTRKVQL